MRGPGYALTVPPALGHPVPPSSAPALSRGGILYGLPAYRHNLIVLLLRLDRLSRLFPFWSGAEQEII
jgi:hypothetical protein